MKQYPRTYEYVFSRKDKLLKNCNFEFIKTYNDIPENVDKYLRLMRSEIANWQKGYFDFLVKIEWLVRRFVYRDHRKKGLNSRSGIRTDMAFAMFMRAYVGYDHRFFYHSYIPSSKIVTYLDDFFPDFEINNPFEVPYEFPYKNISMEYLFFVYQMPERLEVLAYADEQKMSYPEFYDYIVNYINCYNEEHGEHFIFIFTNRSLPYIKYVGPNKKYGIGPTIKPKRQRYRRSPKAGDIRPGGESVLS